jgi:hypothetical protein
MHSSTPTVFLNTSGFRVLARLAQYLEACVCEVLVAFDIGGVLGVLTTVELDDEFSAQR